MKRKLLGLMIPVLGFALIAGTGFSAWYFSESGSSASNSTANTGSIESLGDVTIGTVTGSTFTFSLDQGTGAQDGILIKTGEVSFTFTEDENFASMAGLEVEKYTWTASLDGSSANLTSYVELVEDEGEFVVETGSKKVDLALQYVAGAKPTTKAEYEAMCSALGEDLSLKITVEVTAVFVEA
ncbi:MAG: hypothetical protein ACI311_00775 [Bacilli bacterium]